MRILSLPTLLIAVLASGCSSDGDEGTGSGGGTGYGGLPMGGGGQVNPGGTPANGGAPATGGFTPSNGGATPGGGGAVVNTGGLPGTGGDLGAGGGPDPGGGGVQGGGGAVSDGGSTGSGGTVTIGGKEPKIPAVSADCPAFKSGTISFMGLSGITIAAGAKPASPTAPMLVYWHGTGSTAGEFSFMAGAVASGVQAQGGVIVSFQGTTGGDLLSGTNIFGKGDLTLIDQFVACAVKNQNIDPRKIYVSGCSAGGLFSGAMGALRSSYVAAVAPNSGGWVVPVAFENDHTPALMTVHGAPGKDVVGVDFSNTSKTADTAYKGHGGFVINCNHGGNHCGGAPLAPAVWTFFQAHPFGVDPEPWKTALPSGFSTQCTIF